MAMYGGGSGAEIPGGGDKMLPVCVLWLMSADPAAVQKCLRSAY